MRALVLAPVFYAASFVLTVYADSGAALEALPRPLAFAAALALVLQALATLLFRNARAGAFAAVIALAALTAPTVAIILVLIAPVVVWFARRRGFLAAPFASAVGTIVVILFGLTTVRAVTSPTFQFADLLRGGGPVLVTTSARPDVFVFMLDGYPRSDTLATWGYNNGWFIAELEERGFEIASASHSEYTNTDEALPTAFHMRHLEEIDGLQDLSVLGKAERRRAIRASLENPPALQRLREAGYTTISVGHPADYISLNTDRYLYPDAINNFDHQTLNRTMLGGVATRIVLEAGRDRIREALEAAPRVAQDPSTTFLFAHLLSPHTPFLFDRDGELPSKASTFTIHVQESGMAAAEFYGKYSDQVHYLNGMVLRSIDGIRDASPDALIILFSDHGSRANVERDAEWNRTFFAARVPGYEGVFPDDARPIDVFPLLFNALFGDDLPVAAARSTSGP